MFGWFKKDPTKKLEKKYLALMEEAMMIQRGGDIKAYSAKVAEAEEVMQEIERLKDEQEQQ
ncbi:MAG: Lacal_2735 family protein [Saprospiraceae bacterium]|nr:Lacal_2735 family protein [Saprospiraceae bacterium]